MTLIVELMTFNDPFMMIDSDMNSFESQKQHFQLLSLYHTARTFTIRESKLRNGKLYVSDGGFAVTMVKDIYIDVQKCRKKWTIECETTNNQV